MENQYCYKYPRPAVSADCVVFGWSEEGLQVVLIKRKAEPGRGEWAFPGGFMNMDETAAECAERELEEETGLKLSGVWQVGAFSAVHRDPRTRVLTVAFYTLVHMQSLSPWAGDDAAEAAWFKLSQLPALAFDHQDILARALERLTEYLGKEPGETLEQEFSVSERAALQRYLRQHPLAAECKYYRDFQ